MKSENEKLLRENRQKLESLKISIDEIYAKLKKSRFDKDKKGHFINLIKYLENLINAVIEFNSFMKNYADNNEKFEYSAVHLRKINNVCNLIQTALSALNFKPELDMGVEIRNAIITGDGLYAEVLRINHLRDAGEQEPRMMRQKFDGLFDKIEMLIVELNGRLES